MSVPPALPRVVRSSRVPSTGWGARYRGRSHPTAAPPERVSDSLTNAGDAVMPRGFGLSEVTKDAIWELRARGCRSYLTQAYANIGTRSQYSRFFLAASRSVNTGQPSKGKVSKNPSQGFRCSNALSLPSIANGTELCMWVIRQRPLSRRKHAVARKKSSISSPSVLVPVIRCSP